ncbi:MAG: 2-C-methyl-D-erythritol 4-phosphate cytidylyltransferase [Paracoccaceae bacterium]|jgi:2-C-methyl-D-erythritol 4-phosphate cytidylyltransferase/2-C-methyl-D-erythritol 2,4-cyclodiphosphate synthase
MVGQGLYMHCGAITAQSSAIFDGSKPDMHAHAHALIVAAGRGLRAGPGGPKQYRTLGGAPMLARTLRALAAHPAVRSLRVVIHADDRAAYDAAVAGLSLPLAPPVIGGAERQDSVRRGLEAMEADGIDADAPVLIHDAARPFVGAAVIDAALAALAAHDGASPSLALADTLRRGDVDGGYISAGAMIPRGGLYRAQTPQTFRLGAIAGAHRAAAGRALTDDVAVAQAAGLRVALTPGDPANEKITTAQDLARAETMLRAGEPMDIRFGTGFDVHAFAPGDHVTLCGVKVPHDRALTGHSDADVGMHALTDAIFGAIAEGDIGRWFPPSDPQWKGADSRIFLAKAAERVAARGGRILNVDVTLICETPKIGPHADAMRAALAAILNIEVSRVSVKATTTEKLGFTGRSEGIAAQAAASVSL